MKNTQSNQVPGGSASGRNSLFSDIMKYRDIPALHGPMSELETAYNAFQSARVNFTCAFWSFLPVLKDSMTGRGADPSVLAGAARCFTDFVSFMSRGSADAADMVRNKSERMETENRQDDGGTDANERDSSGLPVLSGSAFYYLEMWRLLDGFTNDLNEFTQIFASLYCRFSDELMQEAKAAAEKGDSAAVGAIIARSRGILCGQSSLFGNWIRLTKAITGSFERDADSLSFLESSLSSTYARFRKAE